LSLAFEYHGEHHYNRHFLYGSPEEQKQKDLEKKAACQLLSITLVEVPFWWDGLPQSLCATIKKQRPGDRPVRPQV
jgi:hypothetical protein